jgi:hypothetical protein
MSREVIVFTGGKSADEFKLLDRESTLPIDTIKKNLKSFVDNISDLLPAMDATPAGYLLQEFTVALGIDGKGKVGLLGTGAEAGASATLTLKFTARSDAKQPGIPIEASR